MTFFYIELPKYSGQNTNNRSLFVRGTFCLLILLLSGCAHSPAIQHLPMQTKATEPRMLALFMDGTSNDEGSHTNISKLHKLVTLQPKLNIRAAYIEGVGTDFKIGGMATGWGIGRDVREAYLFLAENYRSSNDQIYLFGFSRGAYAARILAGLVHVAGIPDLSHYPSDRKTAALTGKNLYSYQRSKRLELIDKIYAAYKGKDIKIAERRRLTRKVIDHAGQRDDFGTFDPDNVEIQFMGLWDTVEALAFPDYAENIERPSTQYVDQLCNVKRAAHAVSIDDDRARIFTPILLTLKHLKKCLPWDNKADKVKDINIQARVEEVWFSGAHADVGGGYNDTDIGGVSLNWMISQIQKVNKDLLPVGAKVYQDPLGKTHDPEKSMGIFYQKRQRDLPCYARKMNMGASIGEQVKLKIHPSVFERLREIPIKHYEFKWTGKDQEDENRGSYRNCFGEDVEKKENFKTCFTEFSKRVEGKKLELLELNPNTSCFF